MLPADMLLRHMSDAAKSAAMPLRFIGQSRATLISAHAMAYANITLLLITPLYYAITAYCRHYIYAIRLQSA